jgi:hypothetical protein
MELVKREVIPSGDHIVVIGEVACFRVNRRRAELPLLSVGPHTEGYRVVEQKGMHRIAVVDAGFNSAVPDDEEPDEPS